MSVTAKRVNSDERIKPNVFDSGAGVPISGAVSDQNKKKEEKERKSVFETIYNQLSLGHLEDNKELIDKIVGGAKNAYSSAKEFLPVLFEEVEDFFTTPQAGSSSKSIVYSDWSPAAQQFGMDQQTAYLEHMANTAHQREVADLRAAGLNPVLGVGSGASGVAGHVASSGSSAQKSLNGGFIVDAIGATAAVVTAILTKNPAYGYLAGNAVNAVGDVFAGSKK